MKSYTTLALVAASRVARKAFVAVTTSLVLAFDAFAPSVSRSTAVKVCMRTAGSTASPPGGPPPVCCEDEADDDADGELEVVVSELQALTEMRAAAANEAAKLRRRAGVMRRGSWR